MVGWANSAKPEYISKMPVPTKVGDLFSISDLQMQIKRNYIAIGFNPTFLDGFLKPAPKVEQKCFNQYCFAPTTGAAKKI